MPGKPWNSTGPNITATDLPARDFSESADARIRKSTAIPVPKKLKVAHYPTAVCAIGLARLFLSRKGGQGVEELDESLAAEPPTDNGLLKQIFLEQALARQRRIEAPSG